MPRKIIAFIANILLALLIGVLTFGFGGMFSTSINVTCELQNDGTYTCQARDTLLGWTVSEKQTEHVIGLAQHLKCSGSGNKRGCSQISEFLTTTGERTQLSNLFTTSEPQVTELVDTLNDLMKTKSTPINYTSDASPWLVFTACLSSFLLITLLLRAFLVLLLRNKEVQPATIVLNNHH